MTLKTYCFVLYKFSHLIPYHIDLTQINYIFLLFALCCIMLYHVVFNFN